MRSLLPLASLVLLASCTDPTGGPDPIDDVDAGGAPTDAAAPTPDGPPAPEPWHDAVATLGNNGAGFRPPEVGYAGRVRRAIRVVATTGAEPFEVTPTAYGIYRPGWTTVFFKVRNVGTTVRCFVQLEQIRVLDAAGVELPDASGHIAFAIGSVRTLGTITTATCLAPQESAWAVYQPELTQSQLFAAAEIRAVVTSTGPALEATEPRAHVVPTRMQLTPTDVRVELVNQGAGPAKLETIDWLAFDRDGKPLGWGYLMTPTPTAPLAAGATAVAAQWPASPLDLSLFSPVGGMVAASIVRVSYQDPR